MEAAPWRRILEAAHGYTDQGRANMAVEKVALCDRANRLLSASPGGAHGGAAAAQGPCRGAVRRMVRRPSGVSGLQVGNSGSERRFSGIYIYFVDWPSPAAPMDARPRLVGLTAVLNPCT